MVMKLSKYELVVKNTEHYYYVYITKDEINFLQQQSPYALDRKVWGELANQGLPIIRGKGNYINLVL